MTAVLYISTGIALYGAVQSFHRATRVESARVSVNILYALLCLSVAGFTSTSAWLQSVPPTFLPLIGKAVIAFGLLSWCCLLWLVGALFRPPQRGILIALSVAWAGLLLLNLGLPSSLVYFNITPVFPSYAGFDLWARLSQGWLLVHAVIAVSWGYMLWCTKQSVPTVRAAALNSWWVAILLLGFATGIDLLISAGLLPSDYLAPFAWTVLLMLSAGLLQSVSAERSEHCESDNKADAPRVTDAAAISQAGSSHTYLASADPDAALHLHWHVGPAGQERSLLAPNFRAPIRAEAEAVVLQSETPEVQAATVEPSITGPEQPLETDLAAIVQFTRIALRRIERGKTDAKKFATLFRAIQQKAESVRDTLVVIPAREDIYSLIANVLLLADATLQANGLRVIQRLAKDLPATGVDQVVLEQVLSELLHEAIEATLSVPNANRKPIVLIGRTTQDKGIELSVTDGGAELSQEEIQDTFEALLADNASEREVPLIAVAELIAAQGGRLWCVPNPAGGTIRYLRLLGVALSSAE